MSEQAGRELDALVAERVMGWESITDELEIAKREGVPEDMDSKRWHRKQVWFKGNERMACEECGTLPDYSTSIEAAWEVVERLIALHFHEVQVRHWVDPFDAVMPQGWMCQCEGDNLAIAERATTAPLAICLAALKAVDK